MRSAGSSTPRSSASTRLPAAADAARAPAPITLPVRACTAIVASSPHPNCCPPSLSPCASYVYTHSYACIETKKLGINTREQETESIAPPKQRGAHSVATACEALGAGNESKQE
ncbi:hypothetical protein EON66_07880 [archaeon]|nr:MAG: hypothetical protein EON66_07880 [archaeon]